MNDKTIDQTKNVWDTIVIGGGQAGLAAGYYLKKSGEDFLILDVNADTGDSWRSRWDSLRLFTPAWANGLPGMPFPATEGHFPSKDEVADFMLNYQQEIGLPILHECKVTAVSKTIRGYEITTTAKVFYARSVIVATGNDSMPRIPAISHQLNPGIIQLHSSAYTNPSTLPYGDVLVVGAGTSGLQIAMELIKHKPWVYVAGNPTFHIPNVVFKYFARQFVWFATHILNTDTPMGRKAQQAIKTQGKGAPLIGITIDETRRAGIKHLPRITGMANGWPVTKSGEPIKVNSIIWATGFLPNYTWIKLPGCFDEQGHPIAKRGISTVWEGLYFVGSIFQYGLTSSWLGGVGRDAEFVCKAAHQFNQQQKALVPYS